MARYLTPAQKERLRVLKADWDSYEDCADLDEMCLDGWYSLQQLRILVDALTQCETELGDNAAQALLRIAGIDREGSAGPQDNA